MPLLGKKVFSCLKPLNDISPDETVFTIPHTKEQFRSKAEFEKRQDLYEERIWTCQCTGHINLTHEEAWNSEKVVQKALQTQFAPCYEKPVLEIVHHSTFSLDTLVDQTWLKLQQVLSLQERINLRVKTPTLSSTAFLGIVVFVDPTGVQANPTSNCSSPSSDKENSSAEKDPSPKKWVPPKLLPYKYSIKLESEDKIVNGIPSSDLVRVDRPPSKELLRLFIRASALRVGTTSTSPWVVSDHLVKKHSLPSKFADFLLSPAKMAEAARRAEEEGSRKRKHGLQHKSSSLKKLKTTKSLSKLSNSKKKDASRKKMKEKDKPLKKKKSSEVIEIVSESSDDEVLARLKDSHDSDSDVPLVSLKSQTSHDSDSDVPLVSLKSQTTPKKKVADDSDSDTPLSKLSPKKKKLKLDSSPKSKSPKKRSPSKSPTKSGKKLNPDGTPKKKGRPRKTDNTPQKKVSKKGMKQMTLLDIASKRGSGSSTPSKSAKKTPTAPPTPMVIKKLLKLNRESEKDRVKYGLLVKQAAVNLTPQQKSNLPTNIKDVILKKCEQIKEKKLLKQMTAEQKENYLKEKKEKLKAQRMEEQKAKMKELRKRYEDLDLKLSPLPPPKLVPTPDGLPNECFGDVAMVTEFLTSYGGLLMPDDEYPIYSDAFMKALASGHQGFAYLSRVLVVLLQTLLQDEIAEGYKELRVSLSEIPVNRYTASELVRLCLRRDDSANEERNSDSFEEEEGDYEVSDQILQLLETQEFHQLDPVNKLKILRGLCLRILGSYSVQDYMESKQQEANKMARQRNAEQKQEKLKKKDETNEDAGPAQSSDASETKPNNVTLNNFYGRKDTETDSGSTAGDSMDDGEEGLVSVLKRRRVLAAKQAAEKEKREQERKLQKEKEYKEYRLQLEREKFEKAHKDSIILARSVLRQTPIGTDRNHSRYWIFNSTTPGLYMEKGWVNQDVAYNCQAVTSGAESSTPATPKKSDSITSGSPRKTPSKRKGETESSIPHPGQNLWFTYDSVKELDALMKVLHPQGIRESSLKAEIKKQYDYITKAINLTQRTNSELKDSDGNEDMFTCFKTELIDMELRLRNGGLGGVTLFQEWEAKITSATGFKELGACVKEVQMNVSEKFLKGFMKPRTPYSGVKEVKEEQENEPDEDEEEEEEKVCASKAMAAWFEALETCTTYSRLHVLLGMLESCIKWEKSAENAKCKICRKKGCDEALLLCDECNQAFHMYCLRPALAYIPRGDWFCPACIPECKRRRSRSVKSYAGEGGECTYSGDDDEDIEHEEECVECGGDEGLVECSTCPLSYHLECHNPPLRHPPRGRWVCSGCKDGGTRRTRNKNLASRSKRKAPSKYVAASSSEEEEADEDETPKSSRVRQKSAAKDVSQSRSRSSSSRRRASPEESFDQKPVYSRRPPSELSIIEEIVEKVMKHKAAWPFLEPVDKKEVPDYYTIVKCPMDFQTMKNKLVRLSYSSPDQVIKDAALVFRNATQYNKEDSEVYTCMLEVEKAFIDMLSKKLPFYHYSREPIGNGFDDHGGSSRRRPRR